MRHVLHLLLTIAAAGGCGTPAPPPPPVPADWQTVDAAGFFTFKAPPDLQSVPVQGIDSIVGKYASPTLEVEFDLGQWADPLKSDGYVSRSVSVDGRRARLATKGNFVAIHFAGGDGKAKLTMGVRLNGADPKVAETILQSVDFP